jgi:hypothetical protein
VVGDPWGPEAVLLWSAEASVILCALWLTVASLRAGNWSAGYCGKSASAFMPTRKRGRMRPILTEPCPAGWLARSAERAHLRKFRLLFSGWIVVKSLFFEPKVVG